MTDTHAMSERTYTVTERVIDCDGSCIGPGGRPESTIAWGIKVDGQARPRKADLARIHRYVASLLEEGGDA